MKKIRESRISIESSTKNQLEALKTRLEASKASSVIDESIALLKWILDKKMEGHKVGCINKQTGNVTEYISPLLSKIE